MLVDNIHHVVLSMLLAAYCRLAAFEVKPRSPWTMLALASFHCPHGLGTFASDSQGVDTAGALQADVSAPAVDGTGRKLLLMFRMSYTHNNHANLHIDQVAACCSQVGLLVRGP